MKMTMNQSEIEQAIRAHLGSYFTLNANEKIVVELASTRGADGFEAKIEITNEHGSAVSNTSD